VVARAGFSGLEAEVVMLGDFATAHRLGGALESSGIQLAALTLVEDWNGEHELEAERASADAAIALTAKFGGALLVLCQRPGKDRRDLTRRQNCLLGCIRDIALRADDAGVKTTFHPNSPEGSLFRTSDDYEMLLGALPASVGFTPDLGHIARCGMDPLSVVARYRDRVNHVHVKDMDATGNWALIGTGMVAVAEVAAYLRRTSYDGWLVLEDESALAGQAPDLVAAHLGRYVDEELRVPTEEAVAANAQAQPRLSPARGEG
jgi:inosose dehydratase